MSRSFYGRTGVEYRDEITGNLLKIARSMRPLVVDAVQACGDLIAERAYDLANVSPGIRGHALDGGHMRDHIETHIIESPTSVEVRIGVPLDIVPYAAHQEFGDRGKPFLRPAIDESRQECHDILRAVVFEGADPRTFVRFRRFA